MAHLLDLVKLPADFHLAFLSAIDFRLLAVGVGVALITGDVIFRNRKRRKENPALAPVAEDVNDVKNKPSIAVLPFVNLSSDPEQEYFADGMTEVIGAVDAKTKGRGFRR